jgi:hypothetical protein
MWDGSWLLYPVSGWVGLITFNGVGGIRFSLL